MSITRREVSLEDIEGLDRQQSTDVVANATGIARPTNVNYARALRLNKTSSGTRPQSDRRFRSARRNFPRSLAAAALGQGENK